MSGSKTKRQNKKTLCTNFFFKNWEKICKSLTKATVAVGRGCREWILFLSRDRERDHRRELYHMRERRYDISTNRKYNTAYIMAHRKEGEVIAIDTTANVCIIHGITEYNTQRYMVYTYDGTWWVRHGKAHYHKKHAMNHMFEIINK